MVGNEKQMSAADIKAWRISRNLTRAQASELIGSPSIKAWQSWELGNRPIPNWLPLFLKLLDLKWSRRDAQPNKPEIGAKDK